MIFFVFFVLPDETLNPKVKELHLQTLTSSAECVLCSSVNHED